MDFVDPEKQSLKQVLAPPDDPPGPGNNPAMPERLDRLIHAAQARLTGGISPAAVADAVSDWALHLANRPLRRVELAHSAIEEWAGLWQHAWGLGGDPVVPPPTDRRFSDPGWQLPPFAFFQQAFLRTERWWAQATAPIRGLEHGDQRAVSFLARQMLDAVSPSNFAALNPEVIAAASATGGENFTAGLQNLMQDAAEALTGQTQLPLRVGKDVAATPGRVVLRNDLIELIQYSPATAQVRPEPVLIIPAWIMKYYILDLSPHNSLIGWLVGQGYTVFCISWVNPSAALRDVGLDDYRRRGVVAALDAVQAICGGQRVHACGYCLGGTLLTIAAAALARDHDQRLASLTLLASQTDFTEAGELQLFINESQLAFLEDLMWQQGYLDTRQMAGAFQMLRSRDLIWSRMVRTYLLGQRDNPNDLMAWNADATRMPFRMHAEYLRQLYLNNDLAEGRVTVDGRPVSVGDIQLPMFVVSTETDHVAPWQSVYKIHLLNDGDTSFVLTSGGHNAGIVSEPGHPRRHFRRHRRPSHGGYLGPAEWLDAAAAEDGSWWPVWQAWLAERSGPAGPPPAMGNAKAGYPAGVAAPGDYVMQR